VANEKVRLAIIGTGGVANGHALAHKRNSELVEIVALADVVPGKAKDFAERHGLTNAKLCEGYEEVIELSDVDAVDICTRWPVHDPASLAAFAAGKHVLCEKPMAASAEEAKEMYEAAEKAGVVTLMDFTYRYYPAARFIKSLIDEGQFGEIVRVRTEYLFAGFRRRSAERSDNQRKPDTDQPSSNIIGELGSHMIDLARFYAGAVIRVSGRYIIIGGYNQSMNAILDFSDGAVGTIEASSTATGRPGHYRRSEVHGTKGAAVFYYSLPSQVELYLTEGVSRYVRKGFVTVPVPGATHTENDHEGWIQGITGASRIFAQAIQSGNKAKADFYDGYRSQIIMEAIAKSSDSGQAIDVTP